MPKRLLARSRRLATPALRLSVAVVLLWPLLQDLVLFAASVAIADPAPPAGAAADPIAR